MKLFGGKPPRVVQKLKELKSFFEHMPRKMKIIIAACLVAAAVIITIIALVINGIKPPEPVSNLTGETETEENDVVVDGDAIDIEDRTHKENFFTVLIVGRDKVGLNTDTIMLAAFDIGAGKLNVLSIPRDTMVNVKRSNKKINAAFAVGGKPNIEELMQEVKSVTGIMPDKYAIVAIDGFVEMIDAIGGVTVDVPINMVYSDPAQDLTINIKKGLRTLDGYDAMGFMRYRSTYVEGDIGRVKVQQTFVKALVDKMLKPSTLTKIPQLAEIVAENVETDLSTGNIVWLAKEALDMNPAEDIQTFLLPGEGGYYKRVSYYFLYEDQVLEMINEYFNPYVTAIKNVNIIDPRGKDEKEEAEQAATAQEVPQEQTPQATPQTPITVTQPEPKPEPEQVTPEPPKEEVQPEPEVETPEVSQPEIPEEDENAQAEPAPEPEPEPEVQEEETGDSAETVIPEDFYQN